MPSRPARSARRSSLALALALSLAPAFFGAAAEAADANAPHPHKGKAKKFSNPTASTLTAEESAKLLAGGAVRKQVKYADSGGRGISIMDVAATPEQIWAVILDFGSYPKWIDQLSSCKVLSKSGQHIFVEFDLKVLGMGVQYWIDHTYNKEKGTLTWQLDYSKQSDLDDSTGYWLVYPAPDHPGFTRVEYTVDIRVSGWVPSSIEDMLAKKGLEQATGWVKKQAEAR
jgi:hypothetical protein